MTDELRSFAEGYTAAWCSQDASSVAAFYSPDGRLSINGGTPAVGRQAITAAAQGFMTAFPDLKVSMDELVMDGDTPVYHWTLKGTNSGPGGTGSRVHIHGFERWEMGADGLIAASIGSFDEGIYRRQLEEGVA
jgi:ketosteroid isomerase-like protein